MTRQTMTIVLVMLAVIVLVPLLGRLRTWSRMERASAVGVSLLFTTTEALMSGNCRAAKYAWTNPSCSPSELNFTRPTTPTTVTYLR